MPRLTCVQQRPRNLLFQSLFYSLIVLLLCTAFADLNSTVAARSRKKHAPKLKGQRAVVIDERLSVVRERPDVKAPVLQRLSRGRVIGVLKPGQQWHRVYITRQTSGWVLAESAVRSGRADEAARLLKLIEATTDDFARARLARLCADEFHNIPSAAPRALSLLGKAAESASSKLTRDARRRTGDEGLSKVIKPREAGRREWMLSYSGLDRWNRAGITFEYDAATDRIVYDGAAYRELRKKYPRSAEAADVSKK